SAASLGAHMLLLGGLTAADASTGSILVAGAGGAHQIGSLPSARHDTSAVRIDGSVYLFGGGTATSQLDEILRVDPATGGTSLAGPRRRRTPLRRRSAASPTWSAGVASLSACRRRASSRSSSQRAAFAPRARCRPRARTSLRPLSVAGSWSPADAGRVGRSRR